MERQNHQSSLWAGGLIGVSVLMLQSFLTVRPLDTAAFISVFAFALALPILSCNVLMNLRREVGARTPIREILLYSLGIIASLTGLAFAFLHICWIAFVVFLVSTGLASLIYLTELNL